MARNFCYHAFFTVKALLVRDRDKLLFLKFVFNLLVFIWLEIRVFYIAIFNKVATYSYFYKVKVGTSAFQQSRFRWAYQNKTNS